MIWKILAGVLGAGILACHGITVFAPEGKLCRVCALADLVCHVGLFVCLLLMRAEMEAAVLCFMASLFVYVTLSTVNAVRARRADSGKEEQV